MRRPREIEYYWVIRDEDDYEYQTRWIDLNLILEVAAPSEETFGTRPALPAPRHDRPTPPNWPPAAPLARNGPSRPLPSRVTCDQHPTGPRVPGFRGSHRRQDPRQRDPTWCYLETFLSPRLCWVGAEGRIES